jgi:hypothetical protein
MSEKDELIYDEDDAVKFILKNLPAEVKGKYDQEDVNYVLDVVYEFYDKKGYLDEDSEEQVEVDEDEILAFVLKCAKEDDMKKLDEEAIQYILDGEFAYCKSIGIFTDEDE